MAPVWLQVITLEGWVEIMYYVMDAHSFYNFIYFILLIIVSVGQPGLRGQRSQAGEALGPLSVPRESVSAISTRWEPAGGAALKLSQAMMGEAAGQGPEACVMSHCLHFSPLADQGCLACLTPPEPIPCTTSAGGCSSKMAAC